MGINSRKGLGVIEKIRVLVNKVRLLYFIKQKNGKVPALPMYTVMIEVSSTCNLACPLCPVSKDNRTLERKGRIINQKDFERIVELTKPYAKIYNLSMWGEPLLNSHFFDYYNQVNDRDVWISSNLNYSKEIAMKLAECEKLHIHCSLDGWDKESYEHFYRFGGSFETVYENLQILAKGKCQIIPQFLINDENRQDIPKMKNFIASLSINTDSILFKEMIMDIKNEGKEVIPGQCHYLHQGLYFNSDGYLVPCCINVKQDVNIQHISAFKNPEDLLNGEKVVRFRQKLASDKTAFESCAKCAQAMNYQTEIYQSIKRVLGFDQ